MEVNSLEIPSFSIIYIKNKIEEQIGRLLSKVINNEDPDYESLRETLVKIKLLYKEYTNRAREFYGLMQKYNELTKDPQGISSEEIQNIVKKLNELVYLLHPRDIDPNVVKDYMYLDVKGKFRIGFKYSLYQEREILKLNVEIGEKLKSCEPNGMYIGYSVEDKLDICMDGSEPAKIEILVKDNNIYGVEELVKIGRAINEGLDELLSKK